MRKTIKQVDSRNTKSHLLEIIQQLREQLITEREHSAQELERTIVEIKAMRGIIPICSYCKVIRNNDGAWEPIEVYLTHHSDIKFTHGICPKCYSQVCKEAGLTER